MKKILAKYYPLLLLSLATTAQKIDNTASFNDTNSNHYVRLFYDNDFFGGTDHYYTQGTNIEYVDNWLSKNPANFLLLKLNNSDRKYGVSMEHLGYTPTELNDDRIQYGDRPYSAVAMLKSFVISVDTLHNNRLASTISVGIIGQNVCGKLVQYNVHKWIGDELPLGWSNQITNDVMVNYELAHEKQLFRHRNLFEVNSNEKLHFGTFNTNIVVGLTATFGRINEPFGSFKNKKGIQYYLYGQGMTTFVGYDATLQGGLFNRSCPYTINDSEILRATYQYNYGAVIQYKIFYVEYSRSELSKEFTTGYHHKWGGFRVGIKL